MLEITFCGHSAFILSDGDKSIIIDPFLTGNPAGAINADDVKVDAVLVTHGHGDHLGDAIPIAKRNNAPVIGPNELVVHCMNQGTEGRPMHIGGRAKLDWGEVKLTQAIHGFSIDIIGGTPCGFVVKMGGKTIYHSGDTALFSDMKLIGEIDPLDAALLPIGDNFTMGVDDALRAVAFLNPKAVIPMHYGTFPIIDLDPETFVSRLDGVEGILLKPGETKRFD